MPCVDTVVLAPLSGGCLPAPSAAATLEQRTEARSGTPWMPALDSVNATATQTPCYAGARCWHHHGPQQRVCGIYRRPGARVGDRIWDWGSEVSSEVVVSSVTNRRTNIDHPKLLLPVGGYGSFLASLRRPSKTPSVGKR